LNAASTLNFPQSFSPSERLVQLEGEAYFEIAHRPNQPFIVESNGQRIQVLGTHFNVKAYSDEGDTRTTLVEGSVQISAALTQESLILIPGEQGVLDKRGMYKAQVKLQQVIAWKEGRFDFNGKNLPEVMRELARW